MHKHVKVLGASLLFSSLFALSAQAEGWYAGAEVGGHKSQNFNLTSPTNPKTSAKLDWGYGALAQVGYDMGWVRLETEAGARKAGLNNVGGLKSNGDGELYTLMENVYLDMNTGTAFTPYIGAGLGAAYVKLTDAFAPNNRNLSGSDTVFAYQGIAGVSYRLNDQVSLKSDYRYIGTADSKFGSKAEAGEGNFDTHSINVGFNYHFGVAPKQAPEPVKHVAPAPVVQAPPAPKPAIIVSNYQVFFDFDSSNVTNDAHKIITTAAENAQKGGKSRIVLTGHTDRSGSDKYNMALSLKRAEAVKASLVKQGLAENMITVIGKGESSPLVPTKDGVREPQNRRVEIVLQ